MMLWDHLDLVPMYIAWVDGDLSGSGFWEVHGGHIHTSAYAVLLATTWLSDGQTWMDVLASWLVLVGYAGIVPLFCRDGAATNGGMPGIFRLGIVFLCLYPGHLANLQWGWQVAVFLCLVGTTAAIALVTRPRLGWRENGLALMAAVLATTSFATGVAAVPTSLLLVFLRSDLGMSRRCLLAIPWVGLGLVACGGAMRASVDSGVAPDTWWVVVRYALNLLGAGIARLATDLAPWLVVLAWLLLLPVMRHLCRQRQALPWLGLLLFAMFAAVAVAWGRAGPFGPDHAFATRYVSFSSMFWLGWLGLMWLGYRGSSAARIRIVAAVLLLLAVVNAGNLVGKAARLSHQTAATAQTIREDFPTIDIDVLAAIYFDQPEIALQRLTMLRDLGFAPFDQEGRHRDVDARPDSDE